VNAAYAHERAAASGVDFRQLLDNLADGVSALDAQVRGFPFRVIRESDIAGAERSLQLLRGLLGELRAHVTPQGAPAPDRAA